MAQFHAGLKFQTETTFGEVQRLVVSIPGLDERSDALMTLALAYIQTRRFDEAKELLSSIGDYQNQVIVLNRIGISQAQAGLEAEAIETLSEARAVASSIGGTELLYYPTLYNGEHDPFAWEVQNTRMIGHRVEVLELVAIAQVIAGMNSESTFEEIHRTVGAILNPRIAKMAMQTLKNSEEIADILDKVRDASSSSRNTETQMGILNVIKEITQEGMIAKREHVFLWKKAEILSLLAIVQSNKEGIGDEVMAALSEALNVAREIYGHDGGYVYRLKALIAIAVAQFLAGMTPEATSTFNEAWKVAREIKDQKDKVKALKYLALKMAMTGLVVESNLVFRESMETNTSNQNAEISDEVLSVMAMIFAESRLFEEAKEVATLIKTKNAKVLVDVVETLLRMQNHDRSADADEGYGDKDTTKSLIRQLWMAEIQAGLFQNANRTVRLYQHIGDYNREDELRALFSIAIAQAKSDLKTEAILTFGRIRKELENQSRFDGEIWSYFAVSQAQAGLQEEAITTLIEARRKTTDKYHDDEYRRTKALEALAIGQDQITISQINIQIEMGCFGEAKNKVRSIQNLKSKIDSLIAIATAQFCGGLEKEADISFLEAQEIAAMIEYAKDRILTLIVIAEAQAELKMETEVIFKKAERLIYSIDDAKERAKLLMRLAVIQFQIGLKIGIGFILRQAKKEAMSIENVWYRLGLLSELAVTQIKTELKADAIKTIKVINRIGRNPDYRNFGLKKLSVDLAQEGYFTQAKEMVALIEDPDTQADALRELIVIRKTGKSSSGDVEVERALKDLINDKIETKCFEEALWIIKLLKKGDDQIDALNLLGVAQSQLGLTLEAKTVFDEACKLAQSIGDSALVNIAEAQIQAGLFKEAKDTACLIWSNNDKAKVLIEIASRQIVAGLDIEAMVNLDEIECVDSDDPDPEILGMLAVAKAQAGHFKKAKEIAISIWNRPERELTLREIAAIQARFGRYDEAIETVKSMKEEVFISWALKSIATEQVQSDLFNDAKRTASLMTSSQDVMTIVGAIAARQAQNKSFSEALRTLESHDSREFVQEFTSWKSILEVIELGLSGCLLFQVIDILGWTVLPFRKLHERLRDVRN